MNAPVRGCAFPNLRPTVIKQNMAEHEDVGSGAWPNREMVARELIQVRLSLRSRGLTAMASTRQAASRASGKPRPYFSAALGANAEKKMAFGCG